MNILKSLLRILFIIITLNLLINTFEIDNVYVIFAIFVIALCFMKHKRHKKDLPASLNEVDGMEGITFEKIVQEIFNDMGYKAILTPASHDYGADVIAYMDNEKLAIQCKRYKGKVGISAVQEAIGAKGYYKATKAVVVTNSYFTEAAKNLAKANKVELIDRIALKHFLT